MLMKARQLLLTQGRAFFSTKPRFNPEHAEKINAFPGDLAGYFDDLMRRRPANHSGYINLPHENFRSMVARASSAADFAALLDAQANYLGHRCMLPHSYVDGMLLKALESGQEEAMLEVLKLHEELVYHPARDVIRQYAEKFLKGPYEGLLKFFKAVKGNYLI